MTFPTFTIINCRKRRSDLQSQTQNHAGVSGFGKWEIMALGFNVLTKFC